MNETPQTIEQKVKEILADRFCNKTTDEIQNSDGLVEDLDLDSLDVVEFSMKCEEAFEISVKDEHLEKIKTVQDAINVILELKAAAKV